MTQLPLRMFRVFQGKRLPRVGGWLPGCANDNATEPKNWRTLTVARLEASELETLLACGFAVATGRTADGRVTEYSLTPAGRILMNRTQEA